MTWWRLQSRLCSVNATGIWRICNGLGDDALWTQDPTDYSPRQPQWYKVSRWDSGRHCQTTFPAVPGRTANLYGWQCLSSSGTPCGCLKSAARHWFPAVAIHEPGLNPIEHVWNAIQKAVNARQPHVTTLQELDIALHQEWNQMSQQTCRNLVQSMRRQCQAVLPARGGHIHYWCPCHASVNILMKVTLGKMIICNVTTLRPHLFWLKDFLLMSPSQWI